MCITSVSSCANLLLCQAHSRLQLLGHTSVGSHDLEVVELQLQALILRPLHSSLSSQEHKSVVAEGLEMVEFQAGQPIFAQGEAGDKFYIIREGTGELAAGPRPPRGHG